MPSNKVKFGVITVLCVLLVIFAIAGINKYLRWQYQKIQLEAGKIYTVAEQLRLEKKWPEAIEQYKLILTKYPRFDGKLETEFKIANVYLHNLVDLNEATGFYINILRQKEKYAAEQRIPDSMIELAAIYRAQGKFKDAIDLLEEALAKYPGKIKQQYVYSQLVALYGQIGDKQKMEEALARQRRVQ